ncbi:MAG: efflux RND transporter periplasmic adaptor subunit [Acidobacteriota bacterium]
MTRFNSLLTPALLVLLLLVSQIGPACSTDHTTKAASGNSRNTKDPQARPASTTSSLPVRDVRVARATLDALARAVTVTGTLAADEQIQLAMKVPGRLAELHVDLGSPVSKGQVIAKLIPTDYRLRIQQAQNALQQARARLGLSPDGNDDRVDLETTGLVRQARAVLNEAKVNYDRMQSLWQEHLIARAQLDSAQAALQVADGRLQDALEEGQNRLAILAQRRSELEIARQQLADTVLSSPTEGMVRERHASVGEYLPAGTAVVTLVRINPLRLRLAIPEREAFGLRVGQSVRLQVEGGNSQYQGRVARISPSITEGNRTLMVEAEVPNPHGQLRPGSFARADIITQTGQASIFVPASALVTFAGIEKVIAVRDNRAAEKRVETGRRDGDRVEILSGLQEGETVVVAPGNLVDGQPVRVIG